MSTRTRKRTSRTSTSKTPTRKLSVAPKVVTLGEQKWDPRQFEHIDTGTVLAKLFAHNPQTGESGIQRATNFIGIGDPGVGKTTVLLEYLADAQIYGDEKVLFLSGEMTRTDMKEYTDRFPKFNDIPMLFLGEYCDEPTDLLLEELLDEGYDLILGDSFVEIQEALIDSCKMRTKSAEKFIIDLMLKHNAGNNKANKYTSFMYIQQMTKGGTFVGSNKLKHNTTGMFELRHEGNNKYIEFSKNRRGDVNKRLYFDLDSKDGNISWNEGRFIRDEENRMLAAQEKNLVERSADDFDKIFAKKEQADAEDAGIKSSIAKQLMSNDLTPEQAIMALNKLTSVKGEQSILDAEDNSDM
jgi:predicted ATP-dependent serine protease